VANHYQASREKTPVFMDVGCGFPPVTVAETAQALSGWHVYGIDSTFNDYVLYDHEGHYACFDQDGKFQYFQALMNPSGRALYANPGATRDRFMKLYENLYPLLQNVNDKRSQTVESDGNRLIRHHIRDFEKDNLTFIKDDFTKLRQWSVTVIRCMNVLVYFEPDVRKKMLAQAGNLLEDDGIVIAGTNGLGIQARYVVYRKALNGLVADEFAFGLENLGHIVFMPFYSIHANDPEAMLLAKLARTIRADSSFWPDFSARQDTLLRQEGLCERNADGFLRFAEDEISPTEYLKMHVMIWQQLESDGFLDGAVDTLARAGYDAWKNPAGDIAIKPSDDTLF
jgi:hypothetical protein